MPTKFEEVYGRALFKFTDYSFLNGYEVLKNAVLQKYLLSSIVDFQHSCKQDLNDYNIEAECFNIDLDNEVIEILATGIAYHWLDAQVLNSKNLRNIIHNKDYTSYSPANLLKQMITLRDELGKDYRGKINLYSFRNSSFETLKV